MGALDGINELKKIAGTDWKSISPKQRALADQQIIIMTGLLRQELTGPGVLSDSDKEQIRQVIGDPTKIVSLDDINLEKLNRLETRLKKGLQNSAKLRLERGDDASPQQKAPAGDIVSIKTPDGRTLRVPKSNLQKMKDEGLPFEVMNGQI